MTKNTELFDLIHALTKPEKRFFKLYASLNVKDGGNQYVRLFDKIARQKTCNDEAIRRQFAGESAGEHFAEAKYYLYQTILKALHIFHAEHSIDSQIDTMRHLAEILLQRKLYEQARKIIAKGKELARQHTRFAHYMELMRWEFHQILVETDRERIEERLESYFEELFAIMEAEFNTVQYWRLHLKVYYRETLHGSPRTPEALAPFAEVMNDPLMRDAIHTKTPVSETYFYMNKAGFAAIHGEYDEAVQWYKTLLLRLQDSPVWSEHTTKFAIPVLSNICLTAIKAENEQEFWEHYPRLCKLVEVGTSQEYLRWRLKVMSHLPNWYARIGEFDRARTEYAKFRDVLSEFEGKFRFGETAHWDVLGFNISFAYDEFGKCIEYLQILLNARSTSWSQEVYFQAKILLIVTHYEMKNWDVVENLVKATQKYLAAHQSLQEFEVLFFDFCRKSFRAVSDAERQSVAAEFYPKIVAIRCQPLWRSLFQFFDYDAWFKYLTGSGTFAQNIRERYLAKKGSGE